MIKQLSFIFALSLMPFITNAQGVEFSKENWETILKQAKQDNKLIFVDAYTSWCGPCKWMDANVFPNPSVGKAYNEKFINAKLNMEQGEGIAFANEYQVRSYPTFLFINGEGELVHRTSGSRSAEDFVALADVASDPDQNQTGLKHRYENTQNPDSALLYDYAVSAYMADDEEIAYEVAKKYLDQQGQDKWLLPNNAQFVIGLFSDNPPKDIFNYVVENRKSFYNVVDKGQVDNFLLFNIEAPYRDLENTPNLDKLMSAYREVYSEDESKLFAAQFLAMMYQISNAPDQEFTALLKEHLDDQYEQMDDWSVLNSAAWTIYENEDSKKLVKSALKWALRSVEIDENFYNTDTVAALYFKLGKNKDAEEYALKAIELGEKSGQDASDTKELLNKIRNQ